MEDWRFDRSQVDAVTVLHQSMKGLAYLHSAGIGRHIVFIIKKYIFVKYYCMLQLYCFLHTDMGFYRYSDNPIYTVDISRYS